MWTKAVMTKLGLSLNEAKTSIRDARKERFEFLGYSFGPHYWWKNGQRYRRELYSKPPQPTSLPGHNTRSPSLLRICANHRSSDAACSGSLRRFSSMPRCISARDYDARSDLHQRGFEQPIGQRAHWPRSRLRISEMMFLSSRKFTVISRHALARLHEYASEEHLGKIGAKTRYVMNPRSGFSLGSAGHGCMSLPYGGVPVCGAAGRRALKRPVVPLCV
jgi:hypothetical protein